MDQLLFALEQGSFLNKALEHQRLGGSEDPGQPQARSVCSHPRG